MATCCGECRLLALIACLYVMSFMQVEGVSPKSTMTWQVYWDEKLPLVQAPTSLASLSSRMSTEEVVFYVGGVRQGSIHTSPSLCHPQTMLCGQSVASGPTVCVHPYFYEYASGHCSRQLTTMQEGLFFRPEKLSAGNSLLYPALANDVQGRTFLPAQLAAVMPFNPDKLATYMALLDVPRGSSMATSMQYTLAFCNSKPADHREVRSCHSSIESMLDFATTQLGSNVTAVSLDNTPSKGEEAHVVRQVTLSSADSTSITCHDVPFPYLVYGCHVMRSANVYDVELRRGSGSTFHGVAICHIDTSTWNSAHPAFARLNAQPGDGAICHWLPQNNFLWVKS